MPAVDLSVVTYRPEPELLASLLTSLAEASPSLTLNLFVEDNSPDAAQADTIRAMPEVAVAPFAKTDVNRSGENLGFGRGHNANAKRGGAPWLLVINQDCIVEPGALERLVAIAERDDPKVAAWEMRQIPYEHPKAYDPASLDSPWVSGAATLFRRSAYEALGGFDDAIFMYGEDVDLSWRLRAAGWRITYQPRCAVVHRTYRVAAEVKPLQVFGGVRTNLCLRLRYGSPARIAQGFAMLAGEIASPRSFPGRRRGLAVAGLKALADSPRFLFSRVRATTAFRPQFVGWGYETRRDGAFHAFRSARDREGEARPRVSILIRTVNRIAWLREALASCANQTWENLEVVVVEDGPPNSRAVVDAFRDRLDIVYEATGENVGRSRAGNRALALASGEWMGFLDDDDVLFADHIEVLVGAALAAGLKGAYGLAWETRTLVHDRESALYEEMVHATMHRQPFDRITLWHHNFLPIQAVIFHRSLFDLHGGFAEDMHQLEDWNLWTRYTLEDDFVMVEKTTSKYRVPADNRGAAERQALLDKAYADAVERQRKLRITATPHDISRMAEAYSRAQSRRLTASQDVRRFVLGNRILGPLASFRKPVVAWLKRWGLLR
ncbi:MAG: glycosyltransferase family 2 protein [Betaproteobacteria bacterium]|nr:glycosyltransferase family 2 protein [Betaproteobacteria bacterium]